MLALCDAGPTYPKLVIDEFAPSPSGKIVPPMTRPSSRLPPPSFPKATPRAVTEAVARPSMSHVGD
ncbi:hypothetical protein [Breoghania sp.]|uniref:hypothetical protein n=1 Tax=Breoghania sp. TaxID=2065378 RepID=UPI002615503C|nr:hypothetical protein [Breoghania sp.]MDJ0932238.1 hypothetical protein [Breoghania sp.]